MSPVRPKVTRTGWDPHHCRRNRPVRRPRTHAGQSKYSGDISKIRSLRTRFGAYEPPDRQIRWDSFAAAVSSPRKAGSANPIKAYALSVEESPFRFATPFSVT